MFAPSITSNTKQCAARQIKSAATPEVETGLLQEVVVMNTDACERASERASVQGAESGDEREREREERGAKGFGFLLAGGDRKP